jgi:hypothetical protein
LRSVINNNQSDGGSIEPPRYGLMGGVTKDTSTEGNRIFHWIVVFATHWGRNQHSERINEGTVSGS